MAGARGSARGTSACRSACSTRRGGSSLQAVGRSPPAPPGVGRCSLPVLEYRERVPTRIDDPGHPGEAEIGDAIDRLEVRQVIVLDGDPAASDFVHLGPKVGNLPTDLSLA